MPPQGSNPSLAYPTAGLLYSPEPCLRQTSLTKLALPPALLTLGRGAFLGCDSLHEVAFPAALTIIGHRVFDGCSSLSPQAREAIRTLHMHRLGSAYATAYADDHARTALHDHAGVFARSHGIRLGLYLQARFEQ